MASIFRRCAQLSLRMIDRTDAIARNKGYLFHATVAVTCAVALLWMQGAVPLPGVGSIPFLPVTLGAAIAGFMALVFLQGRAMGVPNPPPSHLGHAVALAGMSALLAVPPILIDLVTAFPRDLNVALPYAWLLYPAAALVAEVIFHLVPLALFTLLTSPGMAPDWVFRVVIFVEPGFQALAMADRGLQAVLVFGNVGLVSAVQIWLFRRYGFGAMVALRLGYYLFWHIGWGSARLHLVV